MFAVEALVAFKLSIDLAQKRSKYAESTLKSASFIKAFVRNRNIMIGTKIFKALLENFNVMTLNGRRLSLENWLKSDICLISLISLGNLLKLIIFFNFIEIW